MSTTFRLSEKVTALALFDGRLEKFGVRESVVPDVTTEQKRCLTDGRNYLWVSMDDGGAVWSLTRYAGNAPGKILEAIAEAFNTDIFSEYQPQYWGFNTQEEWDAWQEETAREAAEKSTEKFYVQIMHYLRGEPHDIRPGAILKIKADIAKKLSTKIPHFWRRKTRIASSTTYNRSTSAITLSKSHSARRTRPLQRCSQHMKMIYRALSATERKRGKRHCRDHGTRSLNAEAPPW
jgi:hypothetical protein